MMWKGRVGGRVEKGEKTPLRVDKRQKELTEATVCPKRYDEDFKGIGYVFGKEVRVAGAIVGEKETAAIYREKGGKLYAKFRSACVSDPARREPPCEKYYRCGNCNLLHVGYERQLQMKKDRLERLLGFKVDEVIPSPESAYRNKAHLVFCRDGGIVTVGFIDEVSHAVAPVRSCFLHDKWLDKLINRLTIWSNAHRFTAYEPWNGKGVLRMAEARVLADSLLLTIVATDGRVPALNELYCSLKEDFKEVALYLSVGASARPSLAADGLVHAAGAKRISGELCGVKFDLSPGSFYQVNEYIAERIYLRVADELCAEKGGYVIDCFSGIGITSAIFASRGKRVTSVEIVPAAVEDARRIARINGLSGNISHICGDVKDALKKLGGAEECSFFVDPPRSGLGEAVAREICAFRPAKVIYMSCEPNSLKADLGIFFRSGYDLVRLEMYDMFPNTKHVETLCLLRKQ